jgi:hypothetical protein
MNQQMLVADMRALANQLDENRDVKAETEKVKAERDQAAQHLTLLKQEFAEAQRNYHDYTNDCAKQQNAYEEIVVEGRRRVKAINAEIEAKLRQLADIKAELDKLRAKLAQS